MNPITFNEKVLMYLIPVFIKKTLDSLFVQIPLYLFMRMRSDNVGSGMNE
jgi:hypothetical protein